ncbi:hypothetical protein [Caldibacillus thermoamylovorans]|uniref:hypothetical protein n=1 Tax=Caldibacillus thermoamylovorans TaxID=35841 RepID=UPI002040F14C|nr:hypothetical protein [Caldibacillus thermoamylovorans]MCM3476782.1 hypothetical protein [Caldibacillus thermoamylovorans]
MPTRTGVVAKKWSFSPQKVDENGCRRQKMEFSAPKCRRERVSSPKSGVSRPKMMTRMDLVVKKEIFPPQNVDEKGSRRQKIEFSAPKCRRQEVSSPKSGVFRPKMMTRMDLVAKKRHFPLKMTTRTGLVAKKWSFSPQKDDENGSRRQKMEFPAQKCRRQEVSSPKNRVFRPKMVTRTGIVTKKWSISPQNVDEKGFYRFIVFPRCETQVINLTLQTRCGLPLPKIGNQIKFNRRPSGT